MRGATDKGEDGFVENEARTCSRSTHDADVTAAGDVERDVGQGGAQTASVDEGHIVELDGTRRRPGRRLLCSSCEHPGGS